MPDDMTEKAHWQLRMDEADAFMQAILSYPVQECGEGLVDLPSAAEAAGVKVAFSSDPAATGEPRMFRLRAGLVKAFVGAAQEMNRRGWVLKVQDAYRTSAIQKAMARTPAVFERVVRMVAWETSSRRPSFQLLRRRMGALVASCPKTGTHTSGSAVDISVMDARTGAEIDRGGEYLEIGPATPMDSPFISEQARRHRREITGLMASFGFVAYPYEFWHYCAGDAYAEFLGRTGRPARYGPVECDPSTGTVAAIAESTKPLNSPKEIHRAIDQAVQKLREIEPGPEDNLA